jgi:leucyl aminopeptidase
MNFTFPTQPLLKSTGELLVLAVFESDFGGKGERSEGLIAADKALKKLLLPAATQEGFKGKADQTFLFHTHGKLRAPRVLLLGLGNRARFVPETLRLAAGRAAKQAARLKVRELALSIPSVPDMALAVRAAVEGILLGSYRFDRYRTQGRDEKSERRLETVKLVPAASAVSRKQLSSAVALGTMVGEATNWARDLVNEPARVMTPTRLAEEAQRSAKAHGLKITVGGKNEIEKLHMGMFLGVTAGSAEPPRLIHIVYQPKSQRAAARAPLALVGKAITFDSGGLSLKTADGMVDMKTDMAGSAAVLGAMQVIAQLAPPFPVHAFIGACENMPSGTAYRPGDVLISRLGKTVEITNTDAEGRLVLGDMLTWAAEHKPFAIVDLATLTGACMVALGHYITGVFGDDDDLVSDVLASARRAGEEMWRLPIHELHKDALKSEIADMKNSGERWGGAINAAVFLREFVGNTPWAHLDIAGPSQSPKDRGYHSKGGTGVGVRTLVELVLQKAEEQASAEPTEPGTRAA